MTQDSSFDKYLQELQQEGTSSEEGLGRFTLDKDQAFQKILSFQLQHPHLALLKLVQMIYCEEPHKINIAITRSHVSIQGTKILGRSQLSQPQELQPLFREVEAPEERLQQHWFVALQNLDEDYFSGLDYSFSAPGYKASLKFENKKFQDATSEGTLEKDSFGNVEIKVYLKKKLGIFESIKRTSELHQLLTLRTRFSSIPISVDNYMPPTEPPSFHLIQSARRDEGLVGKLFNKALTHYYLFRIAGSYDSKLNFKTKQVANRESKSTFEKIYYTKQGRTYTLSPRSAYPMSMFLFNKKPDKKILQQPYDPTIKGDYLIWAHSRGDLPSVVFPVLDGVLGAPNSNLLEHRGLEVIADLSSFPLDLSGFQIRETDEIYPLVEQWNRDTQEAARSLLKDQSNLERVNNFMVEFIYPHSGYSNSTRWLPSLHKELNKWSQLIDTEEQATS